MKRRAYEKKRFSIKAAMTTIILHSLIIIIFFAAYNAISSDLLKKPGKLTKEEFELIKTHTQHGHRILSSS